jgi:hypothetical protein
MGIRLEAGKRYVTRSGWITPPIEEDLEADADSSMRFYAGDESWNVDGGVFIKGMHVGDLVAEHVEVAPLPDVPDDYDHLIVEKMEELGGSFVRTLAGAYICGDSVNRGKIRNTFREYWQKYADLVANDIARANGGAH